MQSESSISHFNIEKLLNFFVSLNLLLINNQMLTIITKLLYKKSSFEKWIQIYKQIDKINWKLKD